MFNLQQAIADWRQKMLAAGIETPVPLEELELHLREEVERQVDRGVSAEEALALAVKNVGAASSLKSEFQKAGSIYWFGRQRIYDRMIAFFAAYKALKTFGIRKPGGKFSNQIRIIACLFLFTVSGPRMLLNGMHITSTYFRSAYSNGSFSFGDLVTGPGQHLTSGLCDLIGGTYLIAYAWTVFSQQSKKIPQKTSG
jgi:hypothetical protein